MRRFAELEALGRIAPPGRASFEARDQATRGATRSKTGRHGLAPPLARRFKASPDAWTFFGGQPPGYRRTAIFWVMSAVKEETRERRLSTLIGTRQRTAGWPCSRPGAPRPERSRDPAFDGTGRPFLVLRLGPAKG